MGFLGLVIPKTRRPRSHIMGVEILNPRTMTSLPVTAVAQILILTSLCLGVGVFTSHFTIPHCAAASAAFFFSGLSAIASAKVLKKSLSLIGIVLGAMTIGALALYSIGMITSGSLTSDEALNSSFYLGLGPGGMEHMVVYPALMWLAWFSGHLAAQREK